MTTFTKLFDKSPIHKAIVKQHERKSKAGKLSSVKQHQRGGVKKVISDLKKSREYYRLLIHSGKAKKSDHKAFAYFNKKLKKLEDQYYRQQMVKHATTKRDEADGKDDGREIDPRKKTMHPAFSKSGKKKAKKKKKVSLAKDEIWVNPRKVKVPAQI